ncbi:butyrophilin subfamily 3 member A1-like [Hemiscyllium ocellatum]|uniref:butyrophilin subfamily 3 member A1-like n=1 Tax=Hemiscyllium ocellatum TaxID=170820 RepID=UPI0029664BF0|nr:butyrophilin subfamily 3 member A1-like [Hemiscyllium ocellatum]
MDPSGQVRVPFATAPALELKSPLFSAISPPPVTLPLSPHWSCKCRCYQCSRVLNQPKLNLTIAMTLLWAQLANKAAAYSIRSGRRLVSAACLHETVLHAGARFVPLLPEKRMNFLRDAPGTRGELLCITITTVQFQESGEFIIHGPGKPIEATVGEDALLECQLVPAISASNMLVQWFKSGLDSPVHVYSHGEDDAVAQHKKYRGRTKLLKNKLTKGAISLRITNTVIFDGGEYRCSADDGTYSEETAVFLNVIRLGHQPWIQMKGYHENGIQFVCKSSGWFPRPEIQWISEDGLILSQAEPSYDRDSNGLVNAQSIIVITKQSTKTFKCRIQNEDLRIAQETTIKISDEIFPGVPDWLAPLLVTILCVTVGIAAVGYWSVKNHRHIKEWKRIRDCEVSVNLDVETTNPRLKVSKDLKSLSLIRDRRSLPDTGKRFTYSHSALGSKGFSSGRHYWEVEVERNQYWRLGVASESVERKRQVSLIPENGFWTIGLFKDQFYINSSPQSLFPVGQIPRKVGVYLSYESGTVSFYNADTKSHLHTFPGNKFTGKLYPFFRTGYVDQFLRICSSSDLKQKRGVPSGLYHP